MRSHLKKRISCILPILISTTTNLLHVYYINIISSETLEKNKDIVVTKPDKGSGVVILDDLR